MYDVPLMVLSRMGSSVGWEALRRREQRRAQDRDCPPRRSADARQRLKRRLAKDAARAQRQRNVLRNAIVSVGIEL